MKAFYTDDKKERLSSHEISITERTSTSLQNRYSFAELEIVVYSCGADKEDALTEFKAIKAELIKKLEETIVELQDENLEIVEK